MTKFNQSNYPDAHPITGAEVENYLYALLPERDEVLAEMEQKAVERKIPIVGPIVGSLFELLAHMTGAKTVFELGSAIGYSTIWWARAVGEGGRVHYTDGSAENAKEARGYWNAPVLRIAWMFTSAMRWKCCRNRSRSSTSSSAISIKRIIRERFAWDKSSCAKADCSSPITCCGAEELCMRQGIRS